MGETRDGYRSFVIELDRKRIPGHLPVEEKTVLKCENVLTGFV
jgi:hypothetical protein